MDGLNGKIALFLSMLSSFTISILLLTIEEPRQHLLLVKTTYGEHLITMIH